jgi:histidinol dehydrogenase
VTNAGAVFLGPYSPVALGDYFIGTNHVLPTGGTARFASPLGVESFVKRMSVAEISRRGLKQSAAHVAVLARMEKFIHHALSVERRAGI